LRSYLYNEIDDNLEIYSARVHGTLNPEAISAPLDYSMIHANLPPINEFSSPGLYIQLLDPSGKVVVKSDNLGNLELPVSPLLIEQAISGKVDIQTVAAGDNTGVRIMVSPLYTKDQTLILEVAHPLNLLSPPGQLRLVSLRRLTVLLTGALGHSIRHP
jgi:hypothetical protein